MMDCGSNYSIEGYTVDPGVGHAAFDKNQIREIFNSFQTGLIDKDVSSLPLIFPPFLTIFLHLNQAIIHSPKTKFYGKEFF